MENFDDIRPYNEIEAAEAIKRLATNEYFPIVINTVFPNIDVEEYRKEFLSYKSVYDFQDGFMGNAIKSIIEKTSSGLTYTGLENVDKNTNYMLVSNHRDIALDATLLDYIFHNQGLGTFEITFGSNLMQGDFVIDFENFFCFFNKLLRCICFINRTSYYTAFRASLAFYMSMRFLIKFSMFRTNYTNFNIGFSIFYF